MQTNSNQHHEFLVEASTAAMEAGKILRQGFGNVKQISYKGVADLVTEYDHKSERLILARLQSLYPHHSFRAEESGFTSSYEPSHFEWLVDPLDGTTNYAHGFPFFAVSIALLEGGQPIVGVVFDPLRDELFAASSTTKATLNGDPIRVSSTSRMKHSLLATGFPYNVRSLEKNNLSEFSRISLRAQGIRRAGAAALDLSYTACGRLDGYWELQLQPWDMAAGALVLQSAGGTVTDISGGDNWLSNPSIAASNGKIHSELLTALSDLSDE